MTIYIHNVQMIKRKAEDFDPVENSMFICHAMTITLIVSVMA
jgi:hypothetical protein